MIINPFFVAVLLDPVAGLADDDEALVTFQAFDADDVVQLRSFVRSTIAPYVQRIDVASGEQIRNALAYSLIHGGIDFSRLLESHLLPFHTPRLARRFFEIAWDECFPGQDPKQIQFKNVTVCEDIDEPSKSVKLKEA